MARERGRHAPVAGNHSLDRVVESIAGISKNRSERFNVGSRSAAVRLYGEHHRSEIGQRSRFIEMPFRHYQ